MNKKRIIATMIGILLCLSYVYATYFHRGEDIFIYYESQESALNINQVLASIDTNINTQIEQLTVSQVCGGHRHYDAYNKTVACYYSCDCGCLSCRYM